MQSEAAILTIGMPVYNEACHVEEAVESLLAQTRGDFVLHISDNASTDETPEICRRLAAADPRIRYELHAKNRGAAQNWDHTLVSAQTELFMWAGAHDRWAPTFVERLVPEAQQAGVILAYGRTQALYPDGTLGAVYDDDLTNTTLNDPGERFVALVRKLGVCNVLHGVWRTDALRKGSLARTSFSNDSLMLAELVFEGCYSQVPEVLFHRRQVRTRETSRARVARVWAVVTGQEDGEGPGWFAAYGGYIRDHWQILADRRASLGRMREFTLRVRTTPIIIHRHMLNPILREELLPKLPAPLYSGIRRVWRRLRRAD